MGQDKGSLIKKSKDHMQKLEEKYLFSYQQAISTSFSVHSWLLRKTNMQTTKPPRSPASSKLLLCHLLQPVLCLG